MPPSQDVTLDAVTQAVERLTRLVGISRTDASRNPREREFAVDIGRVLQALRDVREERDALKARVEKQ